MTHRDHYNSVSVAKWPHTRPVIFIMFQKINRKRWLFSQHGSSHEYFRISCDDKTKRCDVLIHSDALGPFTPSDSVNPVMTLDTQLALLQNGLQSHSQANFIVVNETVSQASWQCCRYIDTDVWRKRALRVILRLRLSPHSRRTCCYWSINLF